MSKAFGNGAAGSRKKTGSECLPGILITVLSLILSADGGASSAQAPKSPVFPIKPVDGSNQVPANLDTAASLATLNGASLQLARKGDVALNEGDFQYAAVAYGKAALASPKDPLLRMMLGIVLSASHRADFALPEFRKAVQLADEDVIAALLLQAAIAQDGDANEAQAMYQDIHRRFAAKGGKEGLNADVSIARLNGRANLESDSAIVQLLLGDAYQLAQEWDRADTAYRKASLLAEAWSKPYVNRGLLYLAHGQTDQAINVLSEAVKRDPNNAQARVWIGEAELSSGKSAQAISTLGLVAASPQVSTRVRAEATMGMGKALADQQKFTKAVAALTEAQRLAPEDPAAPTALGEVQQRAGNYTAAADAYGMALRLSTGSGLFDSSRPVLFRSLIMAQLAAHQPDEALATLRQAMSAAPESAALWCRLMGIAECDRGNRGAAKTDFCNALDWEELHYPIETLTAIAERKMLNDVRYFYQTQLGETDADLATKVATRDPHAVVIHSAPVPNPNATTSDRTKALAALASIARIENRTTDEIRYRRTLTTTRAIGSDWFLLAETYDVSAEMPIPARDAYQQALHLGGLSNSQKVRAQRRLATLTAPAYKP